MSVTAIFRFTKCQPLARTGARWILTFGWCLPLLFITQARGAEWQADAKGLPQYDQLFQQTNGWIGADGDYTVALTNGLTLWLFSDTFVGQIRDGRRIHPEMIHNSAAWQWNNGPAESRVKFFYGRSGSGRPAALISPADGRGFFWQFDAALAHGKLFLFLPQIELTDVHSAFGFHQIGAWLCEVSNPLAPPTNWRLTQMKIPFARFEPGGSRSFGSALLVTNGFVYIYGTADQKGLGREMILARAPELNLQNFASWRFRTRHGWSTNILAAAGLCGDIADEYSVSWVPALRRFVLVCTENGLSDKIIARTAPEPWGPWSTATTIYRCPEMNWSRNIFCYAAKAHPMLASAPGELVVTYAANAYSLSDMLNDARIYWPRFVDVKFSLSGSPR